MSFMKELCRSERPGAIAAFTNMFSIIRSHYMPIVSWDTVMHLIVLTILFFFGLRKNTPCFRWVCAVTPDTF